MYALFASGSDSDIRVCTGLLSEFRSNLYMTGDSVFRHARLEPLLSDLEARRVNRHPRLKVVDAAEDEVDGAAGQAARPDPAHEMVKVLDRRDVVVVCLELDVGVDSLQSLGGRRDFRQPSLANWQYIHSRVLEMWGIWQSFQSVFAFAVF